MNVLERQIIRHEKQELHPYRDSVGKLTIGIGRNLTDNGITEEEAIYLMRNDIRQCYDELEARFCWFNDLDIVRRNVLLNMCFNMGLPVLTGFKKMLAAIEIQDWNTAAVEMIDSKWSAQVGIRADELVVQMKTGRYQ
ncbi:glycoside hydrolase family protein [Candidatus Vondammii sp. HM_W22]|uniref:glycoside hydrolase family protein n=1 Tax=Candidatus Vondammii sp. HM_W22 TaxID=2687299 RepID=UPI002E7C1D53|nr:lysozyme [Candidatus Vondammii sp. HM_W22]